MKSADGNKKRKASADNKKKWEEPKLTVMKVESPPRWTSCTSGSGGEFSDICATGS